jgi:hypothetical protein
VYAKRLRSMPERGAARRRPGTWEGTAAAHAESKTAHTNRPLNLKKNTLTGRIDRLHSRGCARRKPAAPMTVILKWVKPLKTGA